jgi:uncharacterized protein DUF6932
METRASGDKNIREYLLSYVPWFVGEAAKLAGVQRIALLGSITTEKTNPKDIDFLVTVDDDVDLEPLARLGRKLKGRTQQINHGADIFLADLRGKYIGRTCSWKECWPGKRVRCDALNCGKRQYLHDDLNTVALSEGAMRMALGLWPVLEQRDGLPEDLATVLGKLEKM